MANTQAVTVRRALISVSDKTGLFEFAKFLTVRSIEILSTGGTAQVLRESGIPVAEVTDYTKTPEIMGGRVKTLHPLVHGGILARRDKIEDKTAIDTFEIDTIDLVVVNLYPFEETIEEGRNAAECIENIDIGGPAMIRSAAKNHDWVTVATDPTDYLMIMEELKNFDGKVGFTTRQKLARTAFARTARYDAAINNWFNHQLSEAVPEQIILSAQRREVLRYGENPHQEAAFYLTGVARPGVGSARQVQGKSLSYNNLNDTDSAFELVAEFDRPAVAIIKHANPCGVALGTTAVEAYNRALSCDRTSAFGGIIAFNRPIDKIAAEAVTKLFSEVVIAPDADPDAQKIFATKKNLRLLLTASVPRRDQKTMNFRSVAGGLLVQNRDHINTENSSLKVVTKRSPSQSEMKDLLFAFRVAKHVKSNAIVYAKDCATVGIGAGQMSRVDSTQLAARKARETGTTTGDTCMGPKGTVVASDAFFPFVDGLLAAVEGGAQAIIQPGGSIRDQEVIDAADANGIAMLFTGIRHFRH